MKKILNPAYSLKLKNIILFLTRGLVFIFLKCSCSYSYCFNVAQRCENLRGKWQRCFDVVQRCSNQRWNRHVDSTLFNVVNFNVDVHNVVSTLIWRCVTSRRHINLKTTLKRRRNVCWDSPRKWTPVKKNSVKVVNNWEGHVTILLPFDY